MIYNSDPQTVFGTENILCDEFFFYVEFLQTYDVIMILENYFILELSPRS
jgi:hypothetical protein